MTDQFPASGGMARRFRLLFMAAMLLALGYVATALITDAHALTAGLRQLGYAGTLGILTLSLLNYGLRFIRWHIYLRQLGYRLEPWPHLLCYLSGFAFTVTPGKAGEAVRSLYLRDRGVSIAQSMAALFAERILDVMVMLLLAGLIIAGHPSYRLLMLFILGAVLIVLLLIGGGWLPPGFDALAGRMRAGKPARLLAATAQLLRHSQQLLRPGLLTCGLALGLVAWTAECLGFQLICHGLDIKVDLTTAQGIYAMAVLAGSAVFFVPAGIGGTELAMTALLVAQGATTRAAIIATLLCRLATLWFAVAVGATASIVNLNSSPVILPEQGP